MTGDESTVALSLISHTNAGKTTLARTLLGRDVGEVRDAAHVTNEATPYPMIETVEGDRLVLWDTPGFGDSARLAARLAQHGNPIGWFLSEVWDRFRDRPLWLAQQAVRNVRDHADAVLYLVNASEDPADAGYIAPELRVLAWTSRNVIVLLNQTGRPRPREEEEAETARWRGALAAHAFISAVLPLDAFARCWVQEITLLRALGGAVPAPKRSAFERLRIAWQTRRMDQFRASIGVLAQSVAATACDRVSMPDTGRLGPLRHIGDAIGIGGADRESVRKRALHTLSEHLQQEIVATTDKLIAIHELEGCAAAEIITRIGDSLATAAPVSEGKAALFGGVLSGALTGLAADLAAGGLTLGAGMVAGGVLGALGGAGLARTYNMARGTTETIVRWSDEFLLELVDAALLRYLAVAHYGRGRGEWKETEYPPFWRDVIARTTAPNRDTLIAVWSPHAGRDAAAVAEALLHRLQSLALGVLNTLYPGALEPADLAYRS